MEFNFLDIFILPIIFLIGIVASIEDIRTGKIRNKWIIFGLVYGIIIYTMLFFWNELTLPISFVFGFLLWREGVVAAGDVKLFFVFSFLLPTKYYWKSYLPLFPSFALLVNIFVIILVFILCRSLFCFFLKFKNDRRAVFLQSQKRRSFSIKKQVVQTIGMLSIFLLFFWIKHWINSYLGLDIGKYQYLFLVLMIMFSRKITKALFKNNNFS